VSSERPPLAEVLLAGLSFRYPGTPEPTLEDLSIHIGAGEAHALLGSSGAGKSTLLNLLAGLLPVQEGSMTIAGRDVSNVPPAARGVTQVFQFPVLYDSMSVLDNLAFPLRCAGRRAREARQRARDIAGRLEIDALLSRRPARLSLFEKQLVAIGKALVRPDVGVVLLDEPLTAAEPVRKWRLRQTLKGLQRESGATMIYVTHDQTEALTFADRISVLHQGRVLQTGSPEALLDAPAHAYVGYFVGSPGMNFLAGEVRGNVCVLRGGALPVAPGAATGPCRLGFRPEWGALLPPGAAPAGEESAPLLPADVLGVRILGTHRGKAFGLVDALVAGERVTVRQTLGTLEPGPALLRLDRTRRFDPDGWCADA